MKPPLVREFDGLDTSYRIPARRARNYWFLQHIHSTFNKPWERYNAHLHFDKHVCDGQISPSEWDAGGYLEAEFVVDGRMVLYAHFEEVKGRVMEGVGIPDPYEIKRGEEDRAWHWEIYEGKSLRAKCDRLEEDAEEDGGYHESEHDPYPPFLEALPPDDPVCAAPMTNPTACGPSPPSTPAVIPLDNSSCGQDLETSIVVGRAKAHRCRDPNERPIVQAMLNKPGAVGTRMPAKHAKNGGLSYGNIQISSSDADYVKEFQNLTPGERSKLMKKGDREEDWDRYYSLSPSGHDQGILIGYAGLEHCVDAIERVPVRAMLSSVGQVMAFISAKYSRKPGNKGVASFPLVRVDYLEEFAGVACFRRTKVIKERLLERMKGSKAVEEESTRDELVDGSPIHSFSGL